MHWGMRRGGRCLSSCSQSPRDRTQDGAAEKKEEGEESGRGAEQADSATEAGDSAAEEGRGGSTLEGTEEGKRATGMRDNSTMGREGKTGEEEGGGEEGRGGTAGRREDVGHGSKGSPKKRIFLRRLRRRADFVGDEERAGTGTGEGGDESEEEADVEEGTSGDEEREEKEKEKDRESCSTRTEKVHGAERAKSTALWRRADQAGRGEKGREGDDMGVLKKRMQEFLPFSPYKFSLAAELLAGLAR
jgi:hypothetical protein